MELQIAQNLIGHPITLNSFLNLLNPILSCFNLESDPLNIFSVAINHLIELAPNVHQNHQSIDIIKNLVKETEDIGLILV